MTQEPSRLPCWAGSSRQSPVISAHRRFPLNKPMTLYGFIGVMIWAGRQRCSMTPFCMRYENTLVWHSMRLPLSAHGSPSWRPTWRQSLAVELRASQGVLNSLCRLRTGAFVISVVEPNCLVQSWRSVDLAAGLKTCWRLPRIHWCRHTLAATTILERSGGGASNGPGSVGDSTDPAADATGSISPISRPIPGGWGWSECCLAQLSPMAFLNRFSAAWCH